MEDNAPPGMEDPPAGPLGALLSKIGTARSRGLLAGHFMDGVAQIVGADVVGIYVFEGGSRKADAYVCGTSDKVLATYEQLGRPIDFVLQAALRTQVPAHQGMLLPPNEWHEHALYKQVAREFPLEHYLLAPVLSCGRLIGTLNLGRFPHRSGFNAEDLLRMATIAGQVSATIEHLERKTGTSCGRTNRWTPREWQIAQLVSKGCTNLEIGQQLNISENGVKQALKRLFTKLEICSRSELVARLNQPD